MTTPTFREQIHELLAGEWIADGSGIGAVIYDDEAARLTDLLMPLIETEVNAEYVRTLRSVASHMEGAFTGKSGLNPPRYEATAAYLRRIADAAS